MYLFANLPLHIHQGNNSEVANVLRIVLFQDEGGDGLAPFWWNGLGLAGHYHQLWWKLEEVWTAVAHSVGYTILSRDSCAPQLLLLVWLQTIWGDADVEQWHGLGCGVLSWEIPVCTPFGWCEGDHWSVPSALALRLAVSSFPLEGSKCICSQRKLTCAYISSSFPLSSGVQNSSFLLLYCFLPWLVKQESLENSPLSFPESNSKSSPLFFFLFIIRSSNNQTDGDGSGGGINQEGDAAASVWGWF